MILAGDLGGTNARLALYEGDEQNPRSLWRRDYRAEGAEWTQLIRDALRESGAGQVEAAVVAVAGPVKDDEARLTNLGWEVSAAELARSVGLEHARILNDLEAAAHGLVALGTDDLACLQSGKRGAQGNRVLCSPGTGLGMAALAWNGTEFHAIASEGGHQTMSPLDPEDRELEAFLQERHGHVSWERALSGPGLVALHEFAHRRQGLAWEGGRGSREDPSEVTKRALEGDPLAVHALERFAHLLGIAAGNLALAFLARGGVYLGGGIPPRIRSFLARPAFREAFLQKGRMRRLMEDMPVHIVINPDCGLLGSARCALRDARVERAR